MRFSSDRQPKYAVYVHLNGRHVLVARYATLMRAIRSRDILVEHGETAYMDVNIAAS